MGVEKGQGGELSRLGVIEVLSVDREPLNEVCKVECALEGFPEMSPQEFIHDLYLPGNKGMCETDLVTRIEYGYVDWIESQELYGGVSTDKYVNTNEGIVRANCWENIPEGFEWLPDVTSRPEWLYREDAQVLPWTMAIGANLVDNCTEDDLESWAARRF